MQAKVKITNVRANLDTLIYLLILIIIILSRAGKNKMEAHFFFTEIILRLPAGNRSWFDLVFVLGAVSVVVLIILLL